MVKIILILLLIPLILLVKLIKSYDNPYKLVMIYGKKGSGKTTYLTKQAIKFNLKGWYVFSNTEIFNTYKLDTDWVGKYDFPEKSLLLIDEVGMIWDNRNFKSFSSDVRDFFKLQRHKKVYVILASQSFDIDKKLRDLTDEMYLLQNFLNIFTICKKINKYQTIGEDDPNSSTDNSGVLVEKYRFAPFFDWSITFIPRYTCFFNSFETEPLPLATKKRYQFNDFKNIYTNISNRNYLRSTALNWANNKKYNFVLNKLSFDCPFDLVYFLHGEV